MPRFAPKPTDIISLSFFIQLVKKQILIQKISHRDTFSKKVLQKPHASLTKTSRFQGGFAERKNILVFS